MKLKLYTWLALLYLFAASAPALAHYQLLFAGEILRDRGGPVSLKMPFAHPGASAAVMPTERPQALYVVHRSKRLDLAPSLSLAQWRSAENSAQSWQADAVLRGLGDFVFVLEPQPYYDDSEGIYIQQFTKTIINVAGLPTDWDADLGLAAEIVPLSRPYAVLAGGTFSGVVKAAGQPVPFAEVEVEFLNFPPGMDANAFSVNALTKLPHSAFITHSIRADANGTFTFGIPMAGHWGFAALGVGTTKTHAGKPLSQDAVIWVQAYDMR